MSVVQLVDVGHVYDARTPWEHRALTGVQLTVEPGEGVTVIGANGSGKSTLFAILTGAITPTEGRALLDGAPLRKRLDRVGACLQRARLQLFGVTVEDDLRLDPAVTPERAAAALSSVGLDPAGFRARRIDELSGGEQRLVALAGALARRPRLLVLDEPFAGVDAGHARRVHATLARARAEGVATVVLTPRRSDLDATSQVMRLDAGRLDARGEAVRP